MTKPPLTPTEVQTIRAIWKTKKTRSGRPQLKEIGEQFDRSPHTIRNIVRQRTYAMEPATALFIPLKREYFEAFKSGKKNCEYRPYGKRWNEKTCWVGRPVVLSLGYGKAHRLKGKVSLAAIELYPKTLPGWTACYGDKHKEALCIYIDLDPA